MEKVPVVLAMWLAVATTVACSRKDSSPAVSSSSAAPEGVAASAWAAVSAAAKPGMPAPQAGGQPPPPACPLVTDDDMTEALGARLPRNPVQPASPYATVSACHFHGGGVSLTVRTETLDKSGFDATARNLSGGEAVSGMGDAAYFHAQQIESVVIGTFLVLKGKTMLSLTYGGMGMEKGKALAAEKALAARLLPKL